MSIQSNRWSEEKEDAIAAQQFHLAAALRDAQYAMRAELTAAVNRILGQRSVES
jgi:hypothetical protein